MNTVLNNKQKLVIPCEVSFEFEACTEIFWEELKMVKSLTKELQNTFLSLTLFDQDSEGASLIRGLLNRKLIAARKAKNSFQSHSFLCDVSLCIFRNVVDMRETVFQYMNERDQYDLSQFCLECADFWSDFHQRLCDEI